MPPHIGDFISDAVYDGQLKSNSEHEISDHACWFVDVANGVEKRNGTSWEVCASLADINISLIILILESCRV